MEEDVTVSEQTLIACMITSCFVLDSAADLQAVQLQSKTDLTNAAQMLKSEARSLVLVFSALRYLYAHGAI